MKEKMTTRDPSRSDPQREAKVAHKGDHNGASKGIRHEFAEKCDQLTENQINYSIIPYLRSEECNPLPDNAMN